MSDPDAPSTTTRTTRGWLADLCVYAPIGFAFEANRYLPEFASRGRDQVNAARFIGRFAVGRLESRLGPLGPLLKTVSAPAGPSATPPTARTTPAQGSPAARQSSPAPPKPKASPSDGGPETSSSTPGKRRSTKQGAGKPKARAAGPGPVKVPRSPATERTAAGGDPTTDGASTDSALAIEGYSNLAASQVVPRLATLGRADLEAIGRYERANRGRRTILNRVAQLLAER